MVYRRSALLLEANRELTAILQIICTLAGLELEVVATPQAVYAAARVRSLALVIVDCSLTLSSGMGIYADIVSQIEVPIYAIHPREESIDVLKQLTNRPVVWLSPDFQVLSLLDRFCLLRATSSETRDQAVERSEVTKLTLSALTSREREVLILVARGVCYKQIAVRLDMGLSTVKSHVSRIKAKWNAHTREEVIAVYDRLSTG